METIVLDVSKKDADILSSLLHGVNNVECTVISRNGIDGNEALSLIITFVLSATPPIYEIIAQLLRGESRSITIHYDGMTIENVTEDTLRKILKDRKRS